MEQNSEKHEKIKLENEEQLQKKVEGHGLL